MQYYSTRGKEKKVDAASAIIKGLASDGGLYVPVSLPAIGKVDQLPVNSYQELAAAIASPFLSGYDRTEVDAAVVKAYNPESFAHPSVTPLHRLNENLFILELWHGPTGAFKDIALQILPHLLSGAMQKRSDKSKIVILTATSGDTGKSALEGFRDIPGVEIIVYFPEKGVSEIQKRQMITQEGANVLVAAVKGNFDDAQRGVKNIFSDQALAEKLADEKILLSSANSINWGRLLPQIVYYFSAYSELVSLGRVKTGELVDFVVPTGNFGNILAGFYARKLGLPVNRLICASNSNNVLVDFIESGCYNSNRELMLTISPSMDILVSSNLERLLFELANHDAELIAGWMAELKEKGSYQIDNGTLKALRSLFAAGYADDRETMATINKIYDSYGYLIDTHTAVGLAVYEKYRAVSAGQNLPAIVLSTASPFKFAGSVYSAITSSRADREASSEFRVLDLLAEKTGLTIPAGLQNLDQKQVKHEEVVSPEDMHNHLLAALGLC